MSYLFLFPARWWDLIELFPRPEIVSRHIIIVSFFWLCFFFHDTPLYMCGFITRDYCISGCREPFYFSSTELTSTDRRRILHPLLNNNPILNISEQRDGPQHPPHPRFSDAARLQSVLSPASQTRWSPQSLGYSHSQTAHARKSKLYLQLSKFPMNNYKIMSVISI